MSPRRVPQSQLLDCFPKQSCIKCVMLKSTIIIQIIIFWVEHVVLIFSVYHVLVSPKNDVISITSNIAAETMFINLLNQHRLYIYRETFLKM